MKIGTGKIVIYGIGGISKTTFASHFPDPLSIDTEGGSLDLDVKRANPAPASWSMLLGYMSEIKADLTLCRTLVIDTTDCAERIRAKHVMASHRVKGIEDFGYGEGHTFESKKFCHLSNIKSGVVEVGVNAVAITHSHVQKFGQPDELGTYDQWSLKLVGTPKASKSSMLKEWAGILLVANYETMILKLNQKTGTHVEATGNKHVMGTTHHAA